MNLFNHMFTTVWIPQCMFYALAYNPILCYLFLFKLFQLWRQELLQLATVSLHHRACVGVLEYLTLP